MFDNEGECKVGFWKQDAANFSRLNAPISRPYGKFAHYFKDGSFKTTDGIYLGNEKLWNYKLKDITIDDYMTNFDVPALLKQLQVKK